MYEGWGWFRTDEKNLECYLSGTNVIQEGALSDQQADLSGVWSNFFEGREEIWVEESADNEKETDVLNSYKVRDPLKSWN